MKAGKINAWICEHRHATVCINEVDGVTPYMLRCRTEGCTSMGHSQFAYPDECKKLVPTWGWYKPDDEEFNKLDDDWKGHIINGGLCIRALTPERLEDLANEFGYLHFITDSTPKD